MTTFSHRALEPEPAAQSAAVLPLSTSVVEDVLKSSGHPLDRETRSDFEWRFGHDFSGVRVHADPAAATSASTLHANAYTVGQHLVFNSGQYTPRSEPGRRLLAHELTHVIQQRGAASEDNRRAVDNRPACEAEAKANAISLSQGRRAHVRVSARRGVVQRDEKPLDEKAKKIIEAAKDPKQPEESRAIAAVTSILKAYWDPSLVTEVVYLKGESGLGTTSVGSGKDTKGKLTVGSYFVEQIDNFARRVIQVGHELEHIRQYRTGLAGGTKSHEREFLANDWSAREPEKAGTGEMAPTMRRGYADEALHHFYCLSADDQKRYQKQKDDLVSFREAQNKASKTKTDPPPAECKKAEPK
jgi:Domain of unknown function (DUF4157)